MLGRDRERSRMLACLDQAIQGRAGFVAVTGDPGIGKTRLCAETLSEARRRGARTAVGRCSQDDGAPPLYPWLSVLTDLDAPLPELVGGEGGDFRTWEQISAAIRQACQERPVVVVLDDLHWADTATLRVLRLLVESVSVERLMVVATWRSRPAPEGALGDLAETLARHHAERVELAGLDGAAVAGIVDAVTEHRPSDEQAAALRDRTDGNPFFLVEYSRLVGRGDDLAALLSEADPPTAVQEVVGRRLERLPGETRRVLRTAAVIGRRFDVPVLAQALDLDEDEVLDLLDTAQAVGLVHEEGVDRFGFDHALVRDTLNSLTSPSRRARQHARVAEVLAGVLRPGDRDRDPLAGRRAEPRRPGVACGRRRRRRGAAVARPRGGRGPLRPGPGRPGARPDRRRPRPLRAARGPHAVPPVGRALAGGDHRRPGRDRRGDPPRRRSTARPGGDPHAARGAVAVGAPRRGQRGDRRRAAPQPGPPPTRRLRPPLPLPDRPGRGALLRQQRRGAPGADHRGDRDGPAAGRARPPDRHLPRGRQRDLGTRPGDRAPRARPGGARPRSSRPATPTPRSPPAPRCPSRPGSSAVRTRCGRSTTRLVRSRSGCGCRTRSSCSTPWWWPGWRWPASSSGATRSSPPCWRSSSGPTCPRPRTRSEVSSPRSACGVARPCPRRS